jgi:hypothetical protein
MDLSLRESKKQRRALRANAAEQKRAAREQCSHEKRRAKIEGADRVDRS